VPWAIPVVTPDEVAACGPVFITAQVANSAANKHITAIKPVWFEPRLRLPGGFSYVCMIFTPSVPNPKFATLDHGSIGLDDE
jgi:hypothetical protein